MYAEVGREEYTSKLTQFESEGYQAVDADNQQAVKGMGESHAVVVQVLSTVSSTIMVKIFIAIFSAYSYEWLEYFWYLEFCGCQAYVFQG